MSHAPAGLRRAAHGVRGHFQIGLSQLKLLFLDVARGALVRSLRRANGFAYRKLCERVRRVSNENPKVAALGEFLTRLRAMNCRRCSMRRAIYAAAARARYPRSSEDLKIDEFKPEYLGKLEFYLEAIDRDVHTHHGQRISLPVACASP